MIHVTCGDDAVSTKKTARLRAVRTAGARHTSRPPTGPAAPTPRAYDRLQPRSHWGPPPQQEDRPPVVGSTRAPPTEPLGRDVPVRRIARDDDARRRADAVHPGAGRAARSPASLDRRH